MLRVDAGLALVGAGVPSFLVVIEVSVEESAVLMAGFFTCCFKLGSCFFTPPGYWKTSCFEPVDGGRINVGRSESLALREFEAVNDSALDLVTD